MYNLLLLVKSHLQQPFGFSKNPGVGTSKAASTLAALLGVCSSLLGVVSFRGDAGIGIPA